MSLAVGHVLSHSHSIAPLGTGGTRELCSADRCDAQSEGGAQGVAGARRGRSRPPGPLPAQSRGHRQALRSDIVNIHSILYVFFWRLALGGRR